MDFKFCLRSAGCPPCTGIPYLIIYSRMRNDVIGAIYSNPEEEGDGAQYGESNSNRIFQPQSHSALYQIRLQTRGHLVDTDKTYLQCKGF